MADLGQRFRLRTSRKSASHDRSGCAMAARTTSFAARDRVRNEIGEVCRSGTGPGPLLHGVLDRLRTQVGFDAVFISATDPSTMLFSQAGIVEGIPSAMCAPWLDNEFAADDFNKYADLHRTHSGPSTLQRATFGRPARSARHRELNTAYGFGPELRATFSVDGECWGALNLLRAENAADFDDADLDLVGSVSEFVAKGLRRIVLAVDVDGEPHAEPGVILLDGDGSVVSMTEHAALYLAELAHPEVQQAGMTLPGEAYVVGARARARASGVPGPSPVARTRARNGQWLTLRADCSRNVSGAVVSTAIVIEPSRTSEMLPLFVAAHGLSSREQAVLAELVKGATTAETATALHISPHTVRDHVKSLHEKVGVRSRAELISQLYRLHYAPGFEVQHHI
ncbi:LuxR family transcriptional regulator [Egibacter rhizosphaerae]|uniref:LuxR family transcriptional regulator n=1 Tax=Egibacter rhizosphaerae TaxID=1670831 RepID=A0A411YFR9_9ACTN|nr:helix-turn-helix transcriptional regulator [Egibacter rhizosphaerae]QBI19967.1 LuxR family transcriptional regulator [Egibacter rhizosphaerae]